MQEMKKYKIDGEEYEIGHFMTSKSTKMFARLTKLVLGPIGAGISDNSGASMDSVLDSAIDIDKMLTAIAANIDEDQVVSTVKELMSEVRLGTGMQFNFETHFMGRLMHMMKVLKAVLEHNYADFFGGVSGAVSGAIQRFMSRATAASTAQSGASSSQGSRPSKK